MKNAFPQKWIWPAIFLHAITAISLGQRATEDGPANPLSYGVVMDDPAMKEVVITKDIPYLKEEKGSLHFDMYSPPRLNQKSRVPAIIFLNALGDRQGQPKIKTWGIYSSWPKLVAAHGYIGISMETDAARTQESIRGLFDFIAKNGVALHIDPDRLGVYAASANVRASVDYLMSPEAYPGIRAAVLYYGGAPTGPFRKNLPVFFVVSEGDAGRNGYGGLWTEVLKNNAPWTIVMGTQMPHAFDAYADNDEARRIIRETIAFWKCQLDPVPVPSFPHSNMRDVLGLLRMDPPKALGLLKSMADNHPNDIRILTLYAGALRESGDLDQALPVYQKIIKLEPDNAQALVNLASIFYRKNENEKAEHYVSLAAESGKMTAGFYGDLGYQLLIANKNREAAKYYEKATALEPNIHDYYNLACAYAKAGDKDKAFHCMDKAIALGFDSRQQVENDEDFVSLKSDTRYNSLLSKLK